MTTEGSVLAGLKAGNDHRIANDDGVTSSLVNVLGVIESWGRIVVVLRSRDAATLGLIGEPFEIGAVDFAKRVISGWELPHRETWEPDVEIELID